MSHVKIFSTTWCQFCKAEKHFLDEKGVAYDDVNVETDPTAADEMVKMSGQMGVPVTLITHDDDSKVLIIGFDQARLSKELGLA